MPNLILLYSIFSTTSVQACWFFSSSPSPPPCSQASKSLDQLPVPVPPGPPTSPPPGREYSSTQTYSSSRMSPPLIYSSASSTSESNYSPSKMERARVTSVLSKQSYSENEQASSTVIESSENVSTYDISTCDDQTSNASYPTTTSFFEQRELPKRDLSCIMFDDSVCSITCNQVCSLYNFESTGICTEEKSCYCTIIEMKSPKISIDKFENLSLDDLWDYKFVKSTISVKVLNQIKKYPKMATKIQEMLQKPLRTGDDIKNRLITAYPEWTALLNLKSRKRAPINSFIDDKYKLDESGLQKRIKKSVEKYKDYILGEFSSKDYLNNLATFLDTLNDENQLKYILKEISYTQAKPLIKYMKNYLQDRGLDFSDEDLQTYEYDYVDVDYVDNIVEGVIIKQFLNMISTKSGTSGIASTKFNNKKSSKTKTTQQKSVTNTQEIMTTSTQTAQSKSDSVTYNNVDQCSCPSKKSSAQSLNDDSRWVLPGFDAYNFVADCSGAINEEWSTSDYYVHYTRGASGAYEVVWRKGNDNVNIRVGASGAVTQEWRLNGASVSLSVGASGAVTQTWELGEVSYYYSMGASGSVTRRWRNGYRDQSILALYEGYISSWCSKNYFLVDGGHCVVY
ncbi:uncharacterized protein LOC135844706 [Planococcus citri]|uniref:uncharacterized protein LOC135844706 n=1 Tax=Planococcus citri TaxID=170843 RepID=UPI0031F9AB39